MVIPAVIVDADMMDKGVHFAVKLPRLAKFTKDVDDAGFDHGHRSPGHRQSQ